MSIHVFQLIHFNWFISFLSFQFIHYKSLVIFNAFHFLYVKSFMSIDSCQFIHFISFQFTSFQLAMNPISHVPFFETSAPARAGHYLVFCSSLFETTRGYIPRSRLYKRPWNPLESIEMTMKSTIRTSHLRRQDLPPQHLQPGRDGICGTEIPGWESCKWQWKIMGTMDEHAIELDDSAWFTQSHIM